MRRWIALLLVVLVSSRPASAQVPAPHENLTPIDDRLATLRWQDGHWQLWAGGVWLKDFGRQEKDAQEALRIIRTLRLNQHGTVGSPRPVLEYWLSDGQAPHGPVPGLRTLSFAPETLRVEQIAGQWCVRDERQVLCSFGGHADEARQAQAILRHHGFNQVGYIGQPVPTMIVFLADSEGLSHGPAHVIGQGADMNLRNSPLHMASGGQAQAPVGGTERLAQASPGGAALAFTGRQLTVPHAPLPGASAIERVPFDWRQVQIIQANRQWKLVAGSYTLAEFGTNEQNARRALAVVQHYRFTEHHLVGGVPPTFSYFLAAGQAPRGRFFGTFDVGFRPEALSVRRLGNEVVIADDDQPVLHFGDREQEARELLQVIRRYGFDQLCRIGSYDSSAMTFLVRVR